MIFITVSVSVLRSAVSASCNSQNGLDKSILSVQIENSGLILNYIKLILLEGGRISCHLTCQTFSTKITHHLLKLRACVVDQFQLLPH